VGTERWWRLRKARVPAGVYLQRHDIIILPTLPRGLILFMLAGGSEHWWRLREAALLAFGNACSALAEAEEAGGPHVDSSAIQARSVFRSF